MTSKILKFRNPPASYKVDAEHIDFIKSIDSMRVRHIFAAALGDYIGDPRSQAAKDCDLFNLTHKLNVHQRETLRRQFAYLSRLPTGFIYLAGKAESWFNVHGGSGRGYSDYAVGMGFLEYAKSCFADSIFADADLKIYIDETHVDPKINIEIKGKYTKLFDLIQLIRHY